MSKRPDPEQPRYTANDPDIRHPLLGRVGCAGFASLVGASALCVIQHIYSKRTYR